ncbi:MAG: hypothetical protein EOP05_08495 [Proteobacteria bacterium]|nr:MAG: hypothetical protein EOP05_08495 [Pseudomonadota bacterium]
MRFFSGLMLVSLGLGSVLVLAATAHAENRMLVPQSLQRIPVTTNPLSLPASSQYQTLAKNFSNARGTRIEDLKGWYTGRCYFKDSPSKAVATLLISDQDSHTKTNGPAFQGSEYRHVTPFVNTDSKADKFDSLDGPELSSIQLALKTARDLNAYPVNSNEELVITGHRTTDLESRAYRIRKAGKYFVLKLECAENNYCTNISSWTNNRFLAYEGEAVAYCYYFNKVR